MLIRQITNHNGDILIMHVGPDGCLEEDCGVINVFTDTNDQQIDEASINVYPNPATDRIVIESAETLTMLRLFDLTGRLMIEDQNVGEMDVSMVKKGMYILEVTDDKGRRLKRRVVVE